MLLELAHPELPRTALWAAICAIAHLPLAEVLLEAGANPTDGVAAHIAGGAAISPRSRQRTPPATALGDGIGVVLPGAYEKCERPAVQAGAQRAGSGPGIS